MENLLTEQEIDFLLDKTNFSYTVVKKWNIVEGRLYRKEVCYNQGVEEAEKYCCCKEGKGIAQTTKYCKFCGFPFYEYSKLATDEVNEQGYKLIEKFNEGIAISWKKVHFDYGGKNKTAQRIYYVKIHPEHIEGLIIYKLKPGVTLEKDGSIKKRDNVEAVIEIVPGLQSKAWKMSRKKKVDIDIFDAFQISKKTLSEGFPIYYDGAENLVDFLLKNKEMTKMTGLLECFNGAESTMSRTALFVLYIYLYSQYPVVELLVKMGKTKLINSMLKNMKSAGTKDAIRAKVKELNKLLNPETTRGSLALKIPKYIVDYLYERDLPLKYYLYWCDIYELSNNLSKENFEKICHTEEFFDLMRFNRGYWYYGDCIETVPELMYYGYSLQDIMKYSKKQMDLLHEEKVGYILQLMKDYNRMCDEMEVATDKFPKNIREAHDHLVDVYEAKKNELQDKFIASKAERYAKIVEEANKNAPEGYRIIMPKSSADIIDEGQQQHNCVGSYIRRVAQDETTIFFIRKEESPKESLITAEYVRGNLHQIFYKNNRHVYDRELVNFGRRFCDIANRKGLK